MHISQYFTNDKKWRKQLNEKEERQQKEGKFGKRNNFTNYFELCNRFVLNEDDLWFSLQFSRSVYCSECGKQNYSLAKYCDGCGAKKSDDWEIEVYKRCPKCGKRQSNIVYPDFCPKCGAKLPALRHVKLGER